MTQAQTNVSSDAQISEWLAKQAVPLTSVEAGNGFEDLQPLKDVLKDVRVVGLGEATHGSREFFQMKHRLTEFLVREMGFTAFLLEASYAACLNIDAYVMRGEGDRAAALASQGFWTWDTEEVTDLIEWMRAYNEQQPDEKKVRFLGYDVQRVNEGITFLRDYLGKVAPSLGGQVEPVFDILWEGDIARPSQLQVRDELSRAQSLTSLYSLIGYLTTHRVRLVRDSSVSEWRAAVEYAKNILRYYDSYALSWGNPNAGFEKRDLYMAQTIEEIIEDLGPDAKVVVWAHNGHITTHAYLKGITAMGGHLREMFGDAYYPIGFSFNEGGFQSRRMESTDDYLKVGPLVEFIVDPAPEGYLEWYFAQAGLGTSFVNLRDAEVDWLERSFPTRAIGAGYSEDPEHAGNYIMNNPVNEYDGLIYIPTTTRARPTPTGVRE